MTASTPNEAVAVAAAAGARLLPYKVGIELTMMPRTCSGTANNERGDGDMADAYATIMEVMLRRRNIKHHNCARDGRAVEVPTPPCQTYEELQKSFEKITGTMTDIGLVPAVQGIISGGNHMHVGPMPIRTILNCFRDTQNRPWLAWVFNDADDGRTANSFTVAFEEMDEKMKEQAIALTKAGIDISMFLGGNSPHTSAQNAMTFYGDPGKFKPDWLPEDKGYMLRYCSEHKTLEFRYFDVPVNWEECEAQLMFVDAYVRWIEATYKQKMCEVTMDSSEKLQAISLEQARTEFCTFIGDTLKLPLARYSVWLNENLPLRFERGKRI